LFQDYKKMEAPNSRSMAACTLVLVPPAYLCIALRMYVRLKRKSWGSDDWCMLAAQVSSHPCILSINAVTAADL